MEIDKYLGWTQESEELGIASKIQDWKGETKARVQLNYLTRLRNINGNYVIIRRSFVS